MRKLLLILLLCSFCPLFLWSHGAQAKLFSNAYIAFELPPNWNCKLEGTEWVCVSQFSQKAKEAIIILTAKEVGPTDSLQAYSAHLKTPRVIPGPNGKPTQSKVYQITQRKINGHTWIDGMHLGSEVPSYYTRYLATIKERIAILVTFSAHKVHYTKYSNDFNKAIQSLRVVASKDLLNNRAGEFKNPRTETFGPPSDLSFPMEQFPEENSSVSSGNSATWLGFLFIAAALGLYFYLKTKKKPSGKSRSKRK